MRRLLLAVNVMFIFLWGLALFYLKDKHHVVYPGATTVESSFVCTEQPRLPRYTAGNSIAGPKDEKDIESHISSYKDMQQANSNVNVEEPKKEDVRYKEAGVSRESIGLPSTADSEADIFKSRLNNLLRSGAKSGNNTVALASRSSSGKYSVRGPLLRVPNEDPSYSGVYVPLSDSDKEFVERVVMGEAGGEDYVGKALVAQAIRDAMVTDGLSVREVWATFKYTSKIMREPDDEVRKAVSFIFNGGYVVKHRIMYFYAPGLVSSLWHETQEFVVEHGGHRFFDRRD